MRCRTKLNNRFFISKNFNIYVVLSPYDNSIYPHRGFLNTSPNTSSSRASSPVRNKVSLWGGVGVGFIARPPYPFMLSQTAKASTQGADLRLHREFVAHGSQLIAHGSPRNCFSTTDYSDFSDFRTCFARAVGASPSVYIPEERERSNSQ